MVTKFFTGLAISVGAGLAVAATTRGAKRGVCRPVRGGETMTPVMIRVHTAASRNETLRAENLAEAVLSADRASRVEDKAELASAKLQVVPEPQVTVVDHSVELGELRVMIDSLDKRSSEMLSTVSQRIDDLQNHLPRFIDVKVTSRIREVEERLRTEFQDEQSKALDVYLHTIDAKILPRLAMVEEAIGAQGAELGQMRKRLDNTDAGIARIIDRIERAVTHGAPQFPGYASPQVMEFEHRAVA